MAKKGVIIGASVGGGVGLFLFILIIGWLFKKKGTKITGFTPK
jgi:hypothetical protein